MFAYLKPFAGLPALLQQLNRWRLPTILFAPGIAGDVREQFASPTLRLETEPLDMTRAAAECDLAILNAGHGATAAMLLAGKPILMIPLHLEQAVLAQRVQRIAAGLAAHPSSPDQIVERLRMILDDPRYTAAARDFAQGRQGEGLEPQTAAICDRLERLAR